MFWREHARDGEELALAAQGPTEVQVQVELEGQASAAAGEGGCKEVARRQGQQGEGLVNLNLPAGGSRAVGVELIYPPDATPPQVLTVKTLD